MAEQTPVDTDNPLLSEISARYQQAKEHAARWRTTARECFQFYADQQWSEKDIQKLEEEQRPVVTFNRIKRLVNAVTGHEANNRAEVRYIPRTLGDAKKNEILTEAGKYFRDQCDAEFEESDAFRDMIICGMGWTSDRLSDANNPDYDLIEERVDPLEMLWDPSAKKPNLADGRYLFRRKRYTEKEIKSIWPDFEGPFSDAFDDDSDDSAEPHQNNPRGKYQSDNRTDDVKPDVLVLEYQYKDRESFYVVGPVIGEDGQVTEEQFELPVEDNDKLIERLKDKGVPMVLKRRTITRRCFVIGQEIVQGPDVVCPTDFTYHCMTGYRDRERNTWDGIVSALRDPQRWSNKWCAQIMHILNSNAKGGVMLEENAALDRHAFEQSWADPGAITWVPEGSLKEGRVQPKPPPMPFTGVEKLLEYANQSFTEVSGVNQELLGLADREQAGVLEYQRKQSAVTLLAPLFDSLRRFRYMQGRVWLYMMAKYVSDGRIIRITQDQPQPPPGMGHNGGPPMQPPQQINVPFELPPDWKSEDVLKFDVIVDQAASAPNQKEQTWAVLQQLFPFLKNVLPPQMMMLAVEYSPLPESFVARLKEMQRQIEAKGPPPDPEMMKAQAQIQMKQQEMQMRQQEGAMQLQMEQQKAQMQLEIERAKMQLEVEKANMQMQIERQKADHSMALSQQQAQFDYAQQQQQFQIDAQAQERQAALDQQSQEAQMARDDQAFEAENARADAASQAKIKREDSSARAKARRASQQQPRAE